ncbi:hypothetical protein KJ693_04060 [bacterium]|nr:hypothetical protein [bacterium]MBU1614467.1 hypothetical protein [bacterium]
MQPIDNLTFKKFVENNFPPPYNSMEKWEEYIRNKTTAHSPALAMVMDAVRGIIDSLNKKYGKEEKRLFAEVVEGKENFKTHRRIVEKIICQPEKYTINNFVTIYPPEVFFDKNKIISLG